MNGLVGEMAEFGGFPLLARSLQNCWHGRSDGPATQGSGRQTMTQTFSQLATSVVAALFATVIFVTAAVGPVGQFI
jgi:hypothetical protein